MGGLASPQQKKKSQDLSQNLAHRCPKAPRKERELLLVAERRQGQAGEEAEREMVIVDPGIEKFHELGLIDMGPTRIPNWKPDKWKEIMLTPD